MKKKKKVLIGLFVLMATITMVSGCLEEGKFHEGYMLYKGEERQITGTNYSLILVAISGDGDSSSNMAAIEIYESSEYVTERIFSRNRDRYERFEFNGLKIVLEDIVSPNSAKISIYFI